MIKEGLITKSSIKKWVIFNTLTTAIDTFEYLFDTIRLKSRLIIKFLNSLEIDEYQAFEYLNLLTNL